MDRITRKSLKTDRFADEVSHSVEYLSEHRRQMTLYGSIAGAVLLLAAGAFFYWRNTSAAAHEAVAKALDSYHAGISEEEVPGRTTFKTEAEKNAQSLKDFELVARQYSGREEGKLARSYLGLGNYRMGQTAEAQKRLEQVISERDDNVTALARLTLAEIYASQGKDDQARKMYNYLVQHPTDTVPEARAQLALARFLSKRNPQEARKLLMALMQRPTAAAGAAGNLLREMGQAQ